MEDGTFNRINIIKDKSEMLYDKMMEAYRHKDVRIKEKPLSSQTDAKDNKVLTKNEEEALKEAKGMNKIDPNEYEWKKNDKKIALKWNDHLDAINIKITNYKEKDKKTKIKELKNKLARCKNWNALLSTEF